MPFYRSTVKKEFSGYTWVNGYLVFAATLAAAHESIKAGPVEAESVGLYTGATIVEVRTAGLDTADPNDFITEAVSVPGLRTMDADKLPPPFVTLYLRLNAVSGRAGKKMLRYTLSEIDFVGAGSKAILTMPAPTRTTLQTAWTVALEEMETAGGVLFVGDPTGPAGGRTVTAVELYGVAQLDVHHGWYNRARAGGPPPPEGG